MSAVSDARDALEAAVADVEGLKVFRLGDSARTPGFVLGPPVLGWSTACATSDPDRATFQAAIVAAVSSRAPDRLWDLVSEVAAAIETETRGTVAEARPIAYADGNTSLPAYELTIEIPL